MTDKGRSGREKVLVACVQAEGPLRPIDIANSTGLRRSTLSYLLPRMVKEGLLLTVEHEDVVYYQPQPIFLCEDLPQWIGQIYVSVVDHYDEFFVFDQTSSSRAAVMRSCILESLKLFSLDMKDLMKEE